MFFLSLFLLIPSILATVNYIDFRQDYLSSGYAKTYYLTFSLSNPLDTNHYMKLDFPISLHSTTAFSASWNQDVVAYTHDTNTVNSYLPATMTRSTLLAEASLNTYFIKFLDGSSNPTTLSANTPYMLRIVSSTAYTAGSSGPLDMVGVYITSGNQENNIILDSNPTFSPLYFSTAAVGTLTAVSVTNPSINAAASVTSTVSFTVGTAISANARIILTLGSSQFQFLSTTCAATQTLTMATTNGCFLENAQKLIFKVPGGLTTGSKTVNVVVQAPLEGTVTSALTIYTVQDFYSEIVQTATLSPAYTAATLSTVISAYSATYAWGFPTDATLTRPTCLKLYYYSSTQIIYNTLTFRFTIGSMASLSSTSYKLRVNLAGASGVLENSIRDNLPVATGSTKVVCRAGSAEVTCTPLNSLTAGSTYFVSVRVALTSTTLSADFGKIELFAYDSTAKAYRTNSFVPANRATFTMGYQLNLDRQVSGKAPLTSWPPSTALDANKVGAKLGQVGIFEFNVNAQVSDFGGFSNLVTSGPTDGPGGFEIFTNYKVLVTNNPNYCSSSSAYASSNSICVSDRQAYMTTAPIYDTVRFRIGFYTASDYPWQYRNQAAFAGNIGFQVNYAAGSYPTISSAGYLADDDNLDLYFAAVNKQLNIGTTGNFVSSPNSCFMMNAYTVSNSGGALTNMNVYISNFWTGTGSNYMTGNELPTLIQVKGTLSNTDFDASSNKLSLFFTSLAPFPDEDYATSNRVACSGTQDVKCYYYPGGVSITGNYYMYPRIDIETTMSTTALQIVIPVSTTANVGTIAAVLGVSEIYSSLTSKINLGTLKNGKQFSFSFGPTLAEFYQVENTALNNENYYLATTNKKSGEVSTGTIYASHYDIGNSYGINTGSSQSALYTWTTKYNFYSQTTAAAPPTATFMGSEKCVLFTYYYPADTVYTRRYGVTCPVNSNLAMPLTPEPNINIPNFLFPTSEGVNMPESFGSLCTNLGVLTQFKRDIRTSALSPNYVTAATFDEVIYQSEKASIGTVEFTTTNILPQNSILKLTTTTVPLQFSLKEGYYCALFQTAVPDLQTTLLPQNCYQSAEEHALIFVVNNSIPWTDTKYFLKIYEINVTDFIEISFQYYNFTTFTANNFMIDDTVPTHTTVNPVNFLTQTRRSDLTIESYSVLSNTSLTKTQIMMTVSTSSIKPLTRFNEMRFQFWTAPENLDETFAFDVMDYGSQTTNILKSCRVDLPYIGCTPYYDMLTPQKFTIRLRSFRNPSTSVELKYYMWDLEGNFVLNSTSATPITYPSVFTAPSGFTEFFLEKRFNYITMYPEFIFNIKLSFTLTITSALVVRFPSAYSATDVTDPLLCVIDTLETNCFLSGPQEVTITDLPLDQPADQQFRVSILGLRQPKMTQPYNISVQITTKNQYASVLAYQEVPDIVPAATSTLGVVRATGVSTLSSYSLESPDLTLDFTVLGTAGTLGTTRAIVLDFPNIYGLIYHNTSISYTLTGLSATQTGTVSMQYFRIEIPVPGAGFQKNTAYSLLLKGIPNPFFQTYNHPLLLISITDVNRFGVEYQGQRYHLNVESPIGYTFNPNKHNLQFFQLSGTTSTPMTYLTPFNVFAGLPSLEFEIKVTTSIRFDRMIVMDPGTLNGVEFTSTPTVLNITSGLIGYKFSITFPLDAAPGFYGLKFANVETDPATDLPTTYYSAIPPLLIQLISQQNPIDLPVFVDNTLNLPSGGYSFPINFDLNRIKPPNSLTIVAYIPPTSDIEIQFLGFTEITLTSAEPVGSFTLVHTSGGVPGSSSTTISFYLDGPDKDLYTIDQTPITINLISLGTAAPTLVASVPSATITTNGFSITVTSDQISQVFYQLVGTYGTANNYWEISPKSAEEVDLAFVRGMVQIRQTYINDEFERKDEFYGVWNYQTASVATTFSFDGLRSGVTYKLRVWAVNLKNETSTMYTTDLTTLTNAGKKTTVSFTFNDVLENRQINKIACWLAVRYRLPYENVKDFLGYSCNDHRSRTEYPIDTILSSQYRIYQQRDVSTWQHTYTFYLYPLAFYALDDSYANINTEIGSALFATDLTTFITGWVFPTHPTLVSRSIADTTTSSVDFISSTFTVTSTNRSIAITDLELTGKGFIWVYALRKSAETSSFGELFVPTRGEFKYYLNRRLSDENYVAMRYYDTSAPVDVVFDGLNPSDDYILHWFAQNDDSGNENLTSYVRSQYIQTQSAQMMTISTLLISLLVFAGLFF